jgi:ATP-binding cassette subfamily B (MDR/TAP) protein 1
LLTANRNIRELQIANSQVLGFLAHDFMISLAGVIVAFRYGPIMTLVIVASIPFAYFAVRALGGKLEKHITAQKAKQVGANKIVAASLTGIDLVKVYNAQEHELHNYKQCVRQSGEHACIQTQWNALQTATLKLYMTIIFVIGFFFGVYQVTKGTMLPGDVLVTFYAALTTFQGIEGLGPHILTLVKGTTAGKALTSVTSEQERVMNGSSRPHNLEGRVILKNVRFNPQRPFPHQHQAPAN